MAVGKTAGNKQKAPDRKLNGEVVKAVLYNGRAKGYGKYLAGSVRDQLVVDENGKPLPFTQIGSVGE